MAFQDSEHAPELVRNQIRAVTGRHSRPIRALPMSLAQLGRNGGRGERVPALVTAEIAVDIANAIFLRQLTPAWEAGSKWNLASKPRVPLEPSGLHGHPAQPAAVAV